MIYKYFGLIADMIDAESTIAKLGIKVTNIKIGGIETGNIIQVDTSNGIVDKPELKCGIEFETTVPLADGVLGKLDLMFVTLKREGGESLPEVVIALKPDPQHALEYKLSALYGLTQAQLENYIENHVTNLVAAKKFLKELSAVVLWLVKQTKLDQ